MLASRGNYFIGATRQPAIRIAVSLTFCQTDSRKSAC
ncbi:hypothetical protein EM595_1896 [Duffyella gerundensis]|uniref:Uncharacterized protein n=1 Tax=Duffyella gerundensis TaxID=1619313 RepID=A0A0U5GMS1_9GAMM|nr:hypothetical protein EM595_1896 [Duffyella gerundensis]